METNETFEDKLEQLEITCLVKPGRGTTLNEVSPNKVSPNEVSPNEDSPNEVHQIKFRQMKLAK